MSYSTLDKEGLYDQTQRYKFTNIDDEEFIGMWNGKLFVTVPKGASVTLPESQAINFAKALCDRVMRKEEKAKFVPNMREQRWEESERTRVGIPMARKPYESQILQKINQDEETPEMQVMRSQVREELMRDMSAQVNTESPKGPSSLSSLALVNDGSRVERTGREFEGVTSLK